MLSVFFWDWPAGSAVLFINNELIIKMIKGVPVETNITQRKPSKEVKDFKNPLCLSYVSYGTLV